ncbi:ABC-three component system protein [Paenibacillus sp. FSL M8-0142]|uniref:ABC-three component system protein n=1 Tax=Paenibacillus sp. FSL M8-0142 TaxID=2954525 RepID=UPI003159AFA3
MDTVQLTPYHSAIPSWSGFQYQGKVAINVVLDYILKIDPAEVNRFFLELEWYEDFSIIKDDKYVSIHQVKSYKKRTLSEYKDALWNLLGKSVLKNGVESYLHAATELVAINEMKSRLIQLDPPSEPKPQKDPSKGPRIKGYTPWHYYKMVVDADAYNSAFENLSIYSYEETKQYCPMNELEEEIKKRIIQYCERKKGGTPTQAHVETTYNYLLGELDKHITIRHVAEQESEEGEDELIPDRICFSNFISVLDNEWEEPSEEYIIHRLKNIFHSTCEFLFHELHETIVNEGNEHRLEDLQRAENYVRAIAGMSNDSFFTFCQMVTPHIEFQKADSLAFRNLIPQNGMDVFCLALYEIKQALNGYKYILQDQQKNLCYLPSTIRLSTSRIRNESRELSKIAVGILGNAAIRDELYEIEAIITDNVRASSLESAANKFTDIESKGERNNNITKIKNIRLIDIDTAMEELN